MTPENELHAHIGEVKVGRSGQYLHALLGSCVGIGFLHHDKGIYGLAHCLLSESPQPFRKIGARYVDQAVWSLMKLLEIGDEDLRRVHVFIAGGGNMTRADAPSSAKLVGSTNAQFARKLLKQKRLRLIDEDVGGQNARKIIINCSTGDYKIKTIPKMESQNA